MQLDLGWRTPPTPKTLLRQPALADPGTGHVAVSTTDPNPHAALGMLAMCPGCHQMTSAITNVEFNMSRAVVGSWTGECNECETTTEYEGASHLELHVARVERRTDRYDVLGQTGRRRTYGGRG